MALTPHAESLAALALLYRQMGQEAKADSFKQKAVERHEALLHAIPEAMSWHAVEFYLALGVDPKLALALLKRNLTHRPMSER